MEWFYNEQLAQHHEWRRQKKRNDQVTAYRERDRERIMKRNNPHNLPLTRHWFNSFPLIERSIPPPPGFQDASLCAILPRPIETPKTPPSFTTASFRRRCMGSEPLSPPNPLRLASTNAPQRLPRPDPLPRFLRSPLPPLDCESIGDPRLRVFRVRLPDYLIHGPLDALIVAAEHYSKRLPNGWKTNLYSLTKCDIACRDIPGISSYIDPIMTYISMTMKFLYSCPKITMGHNQPHIVKYAKEIGHTGGKILRVFVALGQVIQLCEIKKGTRWCCF